MVTREDLAGIAALETDTTLEWIGELGDRHVRVGYVDVHGLG